MKLFIVLPWQILKTLRKIQWFCQQGEGFWMHVFSNIIWIWIWRWVKYFRFFCRYCGKKWPIQIFAFSRYSFRSVTTSTYTQITIYFNIFTKFIAKASLISLGTFASVRIWARSTFEINDCPSSIFTFFDFIVGNLKIFIF